MLTAIGEVRNLMLAAMKARQIDPGDAAFIADDYLDAELEGRVTHGLGKFLLIDNALAEREHEPRVTYQHGALARIDGGKQIGQLAARQASTLAAEIANREGVGLVTLINAGRYSRLAPYAATIAREGLAAMVVNNAGPAAVAPYGSMRPILGTNPIAFGFPGEDGAPFVIDFSTAEQVWGEIRQAILEGRALKPGFLDAAGNPTTNPNDVEAVLPFGDHKGSALCVAIELLAGLVAGARMGLAVDTEYDLGAVFMAFALARPGLAESLGALSDLLVDIRSSAGLPGHGPVAAPGDLSRARRAAAITAGQIDVGEGILKMLRSMAAGGTGLEADRLTN